MIKECIIFMVVDATTVIVNLIHHQIRQRILVKILLRSLFFVIWVVRRVGARLQVAKAGSILVLEESLH